MARLNLGIKVKTRSQLINKLMCCLKWYGRGTDLPAPIMTLGLRLPLGVIMAALRPTPRPYHYKQSLTYNYLSYEKNESNVDL